MQDEHEHEEHEEQDEKRVCHCLGLGCGFCNIDTLRAAREAIQDATRVPKNEQGWTHEDEEGNRFKMSAEQALSEERLYHQLWLLSEDEQALKLKPETNQERMNRVDSAIHAFLSSPYVKHEDGARTSHRDFAIALKRVTGLKNASQHAISQGARRAGMKGLASHANRFWLDLELTTP